MNEISQPDQLPKNSYAAFVAAGNAHMDACRKVFSEAIAGIFEAFVQPEKTSERATREGVESFVQACNNQSVGPLKGDMLRPVLELHSVSDITKGDARIREYLGHRQGYCAVRPEKGWIIRRTPISVAIEKALGVG